jgi:hypothetical protein
MSCMVERSVVASASLRFSSSAAASFGNTFLYLLQTARNRSKQALSMAAWYPSKFPETELKLSDITT